MFKLFGALLALAGGVTAVAAEIPRPAPEYTVTIPNGQKLQLSQFKGKVVIVEFLLTTCPHCQKSSALISKLLTEYGPKGVEAIGVAINAGADVNDFRKRYGVTFPVGTAPRESVYAFLQHSYMNPNLMMPQVVFVDRTGTIRAQHSGVDAFFNNEEQNMRAMLDKLVKEGGKAPKTKKKST